MHYQVKETINDKNRSESNKFRAQIEYSLHAFVLSKKIYEKNDKT